MIGSEHSGGDRPGHDLVLIRGRLRVAGQKSKCSELRELKKLKL